MPTIIRTGIGQDSHRFLPADTSKPCILGGLIFDDAPGFQANSDGDVILHALCNAITSLTHFLVLGGIADDLCLKSGITDSSVYLERALQSLGAQRITHVAITIEAARPKFKKRRAELCANIARLMRLEPHQVGLTATSGEGLTNVGCGDGLAVFCIITTMEDGSLAGARLPKGKG
jgi:2-C-methyl-D-erythritol 2,4-cyclodiphosphate synthase